MGMPGNVMIVDAKGTGLDVFEIWDYTDNSAAVKTIPRLGTAENNTCKTLSSQSTNLELFIAAFNDKFMRVYNSITDVKVNELDVSGSIDNQSLLTAKIVGDSEMLIIGSNSEFAAVYNYIENTVERVITSVYKKSPDLVTWDHSRLVGVLKNNASPYKVSFYSVIEVDCHYTCGTCTLDITENDCDTCAIGYLMDGVTQLCDTCDTANGFRFVYNSDEDRNECQCDDRHLPIDTLGTYTCTECEDSCIDCETGIDQCTGCVLPFVPATPGIPAKGNPINCIDCRSSWNFVDSMCQTPRSFTAPEQFENPLILTLSSAFTSFSDLDVLNSVGPNYDFIQFFKLEDSDSGQDFSPVNLVYSGTEFQLFFDEEDVSDLSSTVELVVSAKEPYTIDGHSIDQQYLVFSSIQDPFA